MDLFPEDVGKQDWARELFAWATSIIKFFRAHHKSLAIFRTKSRLDLTQPGWTSYLAMFTSCCCPASCSSLVISCANLSASRCHLVQPLVCCCSPSLYVLLWCSPNRVQ